ncbi:MAG: hypothetical protein WAW17_08250 [Rhodococcus sp. (in: high G+C Gram-positive bacteria)]|uniref:hypothetical protein n=1 Tax=Rhodococcus sp. TaxID=1831 RepID=UPI003BB171E0
MWRPERDGGDHPPTADRCGRCERARAINTAPAARNPAVITAIRTIAGAVSATIPTTNATPDTPPNARQTTPADTVTTPATLTRPTRLRAPTTTVPAADVVGRRGRRCRERPVTGRGDRSRRRDGEAAAHR